MATERTLPGAAMFRSRVALRRAWGAAFVVIAILVVVISLASLVFLAADVLGRGATWLDWQFLTSFDSRFADRAGIKAAIYGSVYMMAFTLLLALPLGVMTAVYLE